MRSTPLLSLLVLALPAVAQNWYIPDNDATVGIVNVIPFGSAPGSSFANCKMQMRATAAELGGVANLITGLGFACASSGLAHYDALEIVIDHIPAAQPLSTTFASNLTSNAVTVLSVQNYSWQLNANTWSEVGLQTFFVFNGVDDVVIQITSTNSNAPGGMRRGSNQRIYWCGASGSPPATGTSSSSATKFEVSMLTARTSTYGIGCAGSNGTPQLAFSGSAQVGNVVFFDLSHGVQNSVALLIAGTSNAAPFPFDLGLINMPGCLAYTDAAFVSGIGLDGSGSGAFPLAVPSGAAGATLYVQYACFDPAANLFGFTTSNYGRLLAGN